MDKAGVVLIGRGPRQELEQTMGFEMTTKFLTFLTATPGVIAAVPTLRGQVTAD